MLIKTLEVLTVVISSLVKVKGIFLGEGLFGGACYIQDGKYIMKEINSYINH